MGSQLHDMIAGDSSHSANDEPAGTVLSACKISAVCNASKLIPETSPCSTIWFKINGQYCLCGYSGLMSGCPFFRSIWVYCKHGTVRDT